MRFWRSSGRPIPSPSRRSQPEWLPDLNRLVEAVKHVEAVSAGAKDPGSTPGASTNFAAGAPGLLIQLRTELTISRDGSIHFPTAQKAEPSHR